MCFKFIHNSFFCLCIFFVFRLDSTVEAAEYKVDVTLFNTSPLVGADSSEEYRAYLSWNRQSADFIKIGRTSNTGTGEVGQGYENPGDGDSVPQGSGLPVGTGIGFRSSSYNWIQTYVKFPRSSSLDRIGVFYATTKYNSNRVTIPIIKMSENAKITPNQYTTTIGIGESVTFTVISTVYNLRWVHNNGDVITDWNDHTEVTKDNIRLADAGIYECFEEGKREMGEHAIMRLIVRACPSPKYGPDCSSNCATCWNGGICAADDGTCLCQPGFAGVFCGTPCPAGWYGANCDRQCHCDLSNCDAAIGCLSNDCDFGYNENFCQGEDICSQGYFGAQCEFVCHCHGRDGCNKLTGFCNNGRCAYGWGGNDCQQALPYFYDNDQVIVDAMSNSVKVAWNEWNQTIDYGTGPVDQYRVFYWKEDDIGTSYNSQESSDSTAIISDLSIETVYNLAVAAVKYVNGELIEGPWSRNVSTTTGCAAPTLTPTITDIEQIDDNTVRLTWTIPAGTEWTQCSHGLSGFIITYKENSSMATDTEVIVHSRAKSVIVTWLTTCKIYAFQIRAVNKEAEGNKSLPRSLFVGEALAMVTDVEFRGNMLQWIEPISSCISDFIVNVTLINSDQCQKTNVSVMNAVVNNTNVTLPGLEYFSTYRAIIRARSGNAAGESTVFDFTTEESVPYGSPNNVKQMLLGDGIIIFTWEDPPCDIRNGDIINYEFEYWIPSQTAERTRETTSRNEVTLTGLSSNETYAFRVRAYTSKGPGPFSETIFASASDSGSDSTVTGPSTNITILSSVSASVVTVFLIILFIIAVIVKRKRHQEPTEIMETAPGKENEAYQDLENTTREAEHPYQGTIPMTHIPTDTDYEYPDHDENTPHQYQNQGRVHNPKKIQSSGADDDDAYYEDTGNTDTVYQEIGDK
ncbi:uncharacterized protein [Amphiura filiformis]|uniref:uncharacterized protein isoform X2 n=1 Tax=Amphiura filiformis TaxID=82378 RepID=UPI003B21FF00